MYTNRTPTAGGGGGGACRTKPSFIGIVRNPAMGVPMHVHKPCTYPRGHSDACAQREQRALFGMFFQVFIFLLFMFNNTGIYLVL